MRRHFRWDKKYLYWGITAFFVIAASIVFYMALKYLPALNKGLRHLSRILGPFIWGLVLTYLLAPLMRWLEQKAFRPLSRWLFRKSKTAKGEKLARALAVLASELVLLAVIVAIGFMITPLYDTIYGIVSNSSTYITGFTNWISGLQRDYPVIGEYLGNLNTTFTTINTDVFAWLNENIEDVGGVVKSIGSGVYSVMRGLYDLVIGIIVSVYILSDLEGFTANARRLLYSIFSIDTAEKIRSGIAFADRTFMGFITGKLLDSAIIGLICYIGCKLLRIPNAMLVSVIIGVTNIIPFFGPVIGAIPSALIILMNNPLQPDPLHALIFLIFVVVLQQVDGNFIGPKILGNSVGISGFWVLFSIIVGAGLFGFWGMLLGVPVFVVLRALFNSLVRKRLKRSDLPEEPASYQDLDYVDPVTRRVVKKQGEAKPEEKTGEEDAQA